MSSILILFILVPFLALILLFLNLLLAPHRPDEAKNSAYECGFSVIYGQTRTTFHIHFYIVAMLFLVFDLELILLYPLGLVLYQISTFGFLVGLLFFTVLTIGFILEIGTGAITIKPSSTLIKNENNPLS